MATRRTPFTILNDLTAIPYVEGTHRNAVVVVPKGQLSNTWILLTSGILAVHSRRRRAVNLFKEGTAEDRRIVSKLLNIPTAELDRQKIAWDKERIAQQVEREIEDLREEASALGFDLVPVEKGK